MGGIQTHSLRLEFPRFAGNDPMGWVYRVEQFFSCHQTPHNQRVSIASFHLEAPLQWFRWIECTGVTDGWNEFVQSLIARFGPSAFQYPTCLLAKLRQTANVRDYQEQFESLTNRTEGLTESFMISCFVAGLKEEI